MKINDTAKGILPFEDEEPIESFIARMASHTPEELEAMEEATMRTNQLIDQNEKQTKKWNSQGAANYARLRELQKYAPDGKNYIGERVLYLREQLNLEPVDVYTVAGIAKTTLYRIEHGTNVPTESVMQNVLYALHISIADFSCFPDDFEKWKQAITESGQSGNIYAFRQEILSKLEKGSFSYNLSGKSIQFPRAYLNILKQLLESSFAILDIIPHDKNQ